MKFIHKLLQLKKQDKISSMGFYLCKYNYELMKNDNESLNKIICLLCLALYQAQQKGDAALTLKSAIRNVTLLAGELEEQELISMLSNSAEETLALISHSDWLSFAETLDFQYHTPLVILKSKQIIFFQAQLDLQRSIYHQLHPRLNAQAIAAQSLKSEHNLDQDQASACHTAFSSEFSIICGGPGSGKTSSVFYLICKLLQENSALKISLAASTGKAAARLSESIQSQTAQATNTQKEMLSELNLQAQTLHRLLAFSPRRQAFLYHEKNQLNCDVLIIDEVSMLSSELFDATLKALKPDCKIICLGDQHQLPAIENGDIISSLESSKYANRISYLNGQYRFQKNSNIAHLLRALKVDSDILNIQRLLQDQSDDSLSFISITQNSAAIYQMVIEKYAPEFTLFQDANSSTQDKLNALQSFQVLTPFHDGELGVKTINHLCEQEFRRRASHTSGAAFSGQRILILENHYQLGLFNGDTGILLFDEKEQQLKAYFNIANDVFSKHETDTLEPQTHQQTKSVALLALPEYVSAYAMSVHKAQGSEFDDVLMAIPYAASQNQQSILHRRLIYTGISRARRHVTLASELSIIEKLLQPETEKISLLTELMNQTPLQVEENPSKE